MKLFDFLIARGGGVELKQLTAPTVTFPNLITVFETVLRQEQEVSAAIDALYDLAFREKAFSATVELQWFLTEQVEEEQSAREILAKLQWSKTIRRRCWISTAILDHARPERCSLGLRSSVSPVATGPDCELRHYTNCSS